MADFTVGQAVSYSLKTRSHEVKTGTGTVKAINSTLKGAFYVVERDTGGEVKVRAAAMTAR